MDSLPTELLVVIFNIWAAECYHAAGEPRPDRRPYQWITCTHVCQRWREVALSSPWLWRRVIPASPDWTSEVIARSRDIPLSVNFRGVDVDSKWNRWGRIHNETYAVLRHNFGRIREARMGLVDLIDTPEPVLAPLLTTLYIIGTFRGEIEHISLPDGSDPSHFFAPDGLPALEYLHITKTPPNVSWSLFRPTIEHLKIGNLKPIPTIASWLSALAMLPNLRCLELSLSSRALIDEEPWHYVSASQEPGQVILASLSTIHLSDDFDGRAAAELLENLNLPVIRSTSITVGAKYLRPQEVQQHSNFICLLASLRHISRGHSPQYATLDIGIGDVSFTNLHISTTHPKMAGLHLPQPASQSVPTPQYTLAIMCNSRWAELSGFFDVLHQLEGLEVRGHTGALISFLDVLFPTADPSVPHHVFFPSIHKLLVLNYDDLMPALEGESYNMDSHQESSSQSDTDVLRGRILELTNVRKAQHTDFSTMSNWT